MDDSCQLRTMLSYGGGFGYVFVDEGVVSCEVMR